MKNDDLLKIERYINDKATEDDNAWIESIFIKGDENASLKQYLEKDWNETTSNWTSDIITPGQNLDRIHHKILISEVKNRNTPLRRLAGAYMKAAAILLIPLLIAGGIAYRIFLIRTTVKPDQVVNSSIIAPMGSRVSFNLPDGTKGMLNSGSKLDYSLPFNFNRKVTLAGEAWFEVSSDAVHPFEITSGNSILKVLGTMFNINAYSDENYIEVVLEEGKITYTNNELASDIILSPNDRLVDRNGRITKVVTDPGKYNSWKEGKLIFRGDPMSEVVRRMERWFNVKIELADKQLEQYTFRGTFQDDTLEEVLGFLSMTSPISYKIIQRKILPDGTYLKEKIIIQLKKR